MFDLDKLINNFDSYDDKKYIDNEKLKYHIGLLFGYKLDIFEDEIDLDLVETLDINILDKLEDIIYSFAHPSMLKEDEKIYFEIYQMLYKCSMFESYANDIETNHKIVNNKAIMCMF